MNFFVAITSNILNNIKRRGQKTSWEGMMVQINPPCPSSYNKTPSIESNNKDISKIKIE